jgi:hypothetical protein
LVVLSERTRVASSVSGSFAPILAVGLGVYIFWLSPTAALEVSHSCFDEGPSLSCVRKVIDAETGTRPTNEVVVGEPIYTLLEKLAEELGYRGGLDDLDDLKQRSLELKRDPAEHRVAITALDNAIASNADEIRPAISTERLASATTPGTNIYSAFVQQKLGFLSSDRATFYDRGPFEIPRRLLLANALESSYFLNREAGNEDKSLLYKEISLLDEVLERVTDPKYSYLPIVNREPQALQKDGTLFWKASVLFVLGEKSQLRELLRRLAIENHHFNLETKSAGHIYIYKVLDLPYEMIVREGIEKNGTPNIDIKDTLLLKRFFNPAQLALVACTHLDSAGTREGINGLIKDIHDLTPSDYYVVAASGGDSAKLKQFADVLRTVMDHDMKNDRDEILGIVTGEDGGLFAKINVGAQKCGIEDAIRNEIYLPFEFRPKIEHIEGLDTYPDLVLFGGRLSATQANTVADFLNGVVLNRPDVQRKMMDFNGKPAYIARMRIDRVDQGTQH